MLISDWSSDVCSSDLVDRGFASIATEKPAEIGWILKTQLIGDFGGRNSRVCQLPLGMHQLLLVHDGDGSEAQEFLGGLTEPRRIHLQHLPLLADLQISYDYPPDKDAKARHETEHKPLNYPRVI